MKVVVFAWGNPARGDDGVGPWFADWLRRHAPARATLIEDFQLQVEHLLDCQHGELLLFIDACSSGRDFRFIPIEASDDIAHTSHALTPAQLLGQYRRVFATAPPPAFQLSVPGYCFALGAAMSSATEATCISASHLVSDLLQHPRIEHWYACITAPVNTDA